MVQIRGAATGFRPLDLERKDEAGAQLGSTWPLTSGFGVAAREAGCPLRRGAPISAGFEDRFTLNFGRKSMHGVSFANLNEVVKAMRSRTSVTTAWAKCTPSEEVWAAFDASPFRSGGPTTSRYPRRSENGRAVARRRSAAVTGPGA